jgi:hypothetical protein
VACPRTSGPTRSSCFSSGEAGIEPPRRRVRGLEQTARAAFRDDQRVSAINAGVAVPAVHAAADQRIDDDVGQGRAAAVRPLAPTPSAPAPEPACRSMEWRTCRRRRQRDAGDQHRRERRGSEGHREQRDVKTASSKPRAGEPSRAAAAGSPVSGDRRRRRAGAGSEIATRRAARAVVADQAAPQFITTPMNGATASTSAPARSTADRAATRATRLARGGRRRCRRVQRGARAAIAAARARQHPTATRAVPMNAPPPEPAGEERTGRRLHCAASCR